MKQWAFRGVVALAITAAVIYGAFRLVYSLSHESTDDAYVTGVIVPVSPEVHGVVVKVYITDNQHVEAGAPLIEIFPQDYSDQEKQRGQQVSTLAAERTELAAALTEKEKALSQAHANLAAAVAEKNLAEKELGRYDRLVREDAASRSQYDQVESRCLVARAHVDAAGASIAGAEEAIKVARAKLDTQTFKIREAETSHGLAELNFKRTVILAPLSGRIAKKNVDPGKYVQPGQPLLSIVQENTWVIANFKETQVAKMAVGQPVEVQADAYPSVTFKGHIDSLQPGTGAVFSLLPPENATGNFVKVVQRLPIKIVIDSPFDPAHPLWPGLSVIPTVDVDRKTAAHPSGK